MAKSIFQILDQLTAIVEELRVGLAPLAALAAGEPAPAPRATAANAEAPGRRRRGPGRKPKKAARIAAPKLASAEPMKTKAPATVKTKAKTKAKKSPTASAALKLHGQYLGYIRQLTVEQKADVKKIRTEKGVEAAIKAAMVLAGK